MPREFWNHLHMPRPRTATVVAALALLISLGGNAAAALIITSNGQVGANTISGHHPPAGAHANIIAGSISSADLGPLPAWQVVTHFASYVGTTILNSAWGNNPNSAATNPGTLTTAAYYKADGMVWLKGAVCVGAQFGCSSDNPEPTGDHAIFTLPVGYRPAHDAYFRVPSGALGNDQATIRIEASSGKVIARDFHTEGVWLDGISYRIDN